MGRTTRFVAAGLAAAAVLAGIALGAAIVAPAKGELAADAIPVGIGMGRTWYLGGFSDLYPKGMSGKEFTSITDRGPNFDAGPGNGTTCAQTTPIGTKVYPLPGFAPELLHLGLEDDGLVVKERTALRFPKGRAVGISVRSGGRNEISVDGACASLGTSPFGIDSEGIVEDPRDGSFWIADEYLPSVMHVAGDGTVVSRVVPAGTEAPVAGTGAAVIGAFPATIGTNFRPNRGFEGIAISPDGTTLYNGRIEGVAHIPARGANPALLAVLNDNDFGLVLPIREQLDVLAAPAVCTPS